MSLTEREAALAYASAWNRLDCSDFLKLLDEDARYTSQWVLEELVGKEAIANYLIRKMETVGHSDKPVVAATGISRAGFVGRDCVLLRQGGASTASATAIFEVAGGKIKKIDLCIPDLLDPEALSPTP